MYDRILIPTDGSDAVETAVEHAFGLAEAYDATVHVLYVVEPPYAADAAMADVYSSLEAAGERIVTDVGERAAAADVESVTATRTGTAHREIIEYAEAEGVDVIVMGTHGRTGLQRLVLGSVTERVVRLSPVPVVTVRSDRDEAEDESETGEATE